MKIILFGIEITRLQRQHLTYFFWEAWDKNGNEYYISDKHGVMSFEEMEGDFYENVDNPRFYQEVKPYTTKEMLDLFGASYEDLPIEFESDI